LPLANNLSLEYRLGAKNISFMQPVQYPHFNEKYLLFLFKALDVANIVRLFQSLLLEKKLFLYSARKVLLTPIAEALLCLIFPFHWHHVLIPILPKEFAPFLQSIVPLMIGINKSFVAKADLQDDCVIADLDHNRVYVEDELVDLPEKQERRLRRRLQHLEGVYSRENAAFLENLEFAFNFQAEEPDFDCYEVRDAFLQFICSIMKKYKSFIVRFHSIPHPQRKKT